MSPAKKLHLLREMIRIRRIEQRCLNRYGQGYMAGFLVHSIGQESTVFVLENNGYAMGSSVPRSSAFKDHLDHVYWETDHNTPASHQGRHFFNDEGP